MKIDLDKYSNDNFLNIYRFSKLTLIFIRQESPFERAYKSIFRHKERFRGEPLLLKTMYFKNPRLSAALYWSFYTAKASSPFNLAILNPFKMCVELKSGPKNTFTLADSFLGYNPWSSTRILLELVFQLSLTIASVGR